jgi:hypothetical protein
LVTVGFLGVGGCYNHYKMEQFTKICTKCGLELPATSEYWHKQTNGKYGFRSFCKKCSFIVYKEYSSTPEYKEKHRIEGIEYRKNNPEKTKEINRRSYNKRKDEYNKKRRHLYHNDPVYRQKYDERNKEYRRSEKGKNMMNKPENREKQRERSKRYRRDFPDKIKECNDKYRVNNKEFLKMLSDRKRSELTPAYVAQFMNTGVSDMPKEIYEFKKIIIQLKRELKRNNIKIR